MKASERQDKSDLILLAKSYVPVRRCPGGRLTHKMYLCLHCGHDDTADAKCGLTKRKKREASRERDDA